jgi:hypothetical protein
MGKEKESLMVDVSFDQGPYNRVVIGCNVKNVEDY